MRIPDGFATAADFYWPLRAREGLADRISAMAAVDLEVEDTRSLVETGA